MKYKKITVKLKPNNEIAASLLMDAMGERGFESFVETGDGFEGYIQEKDWNEAQTMEGVEPEIKGIKMSWQAEDAPDEDWNAEWEKTGYTPIHIADGRCVIHGPEVTERLGKELDVVIDPKNAFGSGHHETTRMIVKRLMGMGNISGKRVMDMGCGTGVLGIVAALCGAEHVDAVDIDEWSVRNTLENAELNHIAEKVTAWEGSAETLTGHENQYDIFIANIFREIIIGGMEAYAAATRPGGTMILSGFLSADLEAIKAAGAKHGMAFVRYESDGDWRMCELRKQLHN